MTRAKTRATTQADTRAAVRTSTRATAPAPWTADRGSGAVTDRIREAIHEGRSPDRDGIADITSPEAPRLGQTGLARTRELLGASLLGLGPLEAWAGDERVTDILVNGDGSIWVDRGEGVEPVGRISADADAEHEHRVGRAGVREETTPFASPDRDGGTRRLAVRLAGLAGRRLDDAQPWVDGLLPGGIRLHAVLPPLVEHGAHVSLRIPRRGLARLPELAGGGMCNAVTLEVLQGLVRAKVSFVITGGTGSGKTTLLGAMLAEVPATERIVLVEDVRELSVDHPHLVRVQGRPPNVEGRGEVRLDHLVRQALRMRPDRLAVGEVRGAEVRELLAALNTGHEGGCGTLHANRPQDLPARFEALGALAGLPRDAVHAQLGSAVQAVVHVARTTAGRRVESVSVLARSADRVTVEPAVTGCAWVDGPGATRLRDLVGPPC